MTDLNGASALVLGATGGLGMALSTELHERGATLTLVGRDQSRLDAIQLPGARHVADLRNPTACDHAMQAAITHAGKLDIVINAVGVVAFGPISELSSTQWKNFSSPTRSSPSWSPRPLSTEWPKRESS